ncbi:MAG TPA: acetyl-CoA synthetase [Desulfotomaculum sp.]|nr:MAG: hypothetical protein VR67_08155 [Peptococcaceae bacterium BRH_c8a]KJS78622.1 MAG: hypothetical protein JL56_00925 [Desulfotomaculum sp. BICA1-6]HBX22098.1 acetyl-CoA synthetase [Desulfotomaculum sp.]
MPGKIITQAGASGRNILFEDESKALVAAFGIPVNASYPAATVEEAVALAQRIGYPIVLKVRSAVFSHKSDIGGVCLNLSGPDAVSQAFREIMDRTRRADPLAGVTVQRMAKEGIEVIIGATVDPHFGPVIMFGLGGVFTEILADHCFRMLPIDKHEAAAMVRALHGARLLEGYRGIPPADLAALESILTGVADLMLKCPSIMELDLNPVVVYPAGALVLDARVKLR